MLAAPVALVVAMFSLQAVPKPLEPELPPDAFDTESARTLARDMAGQFANPRPGSDADEAMGEFVLDRFKAIPSSEVAEQRFTGSFDGEDVDLRNLIVTLPGRSERQVVLIAPRDVAAGSGAATSISSTAILLEILAGFTGASHEKTLVFVSTDGSSIGAEGARRFIRDYSEKELLDAAIVVSQPTSADPQPPLIVPWSDGAQSTGSQLTVTANRTVSEEAEQPAGDPGPLEEVFRLAIPSGLGEQGPLVESGLDSLRVSSAGELPLPPAEDTTDGVNPSTLDAFGRATLSLMLALDAAPNEIEHGPGTYIGFGGNLLPGWALAMMALVLLIPVAAAGGASIASAAHNPMDAAKAVGWVALRAVPFALALLAIYLFAFVGLIPSPPFPFDPALEALGTGGRIGVTVAVIVFLAAAFLLRPLLAPPPSVAACAPGACLVMAAAIGLLVWLVNPYLCLLVAVGIQAWVPAAAGWRPGRAAALGLVALGTLPVVFALVSLAGRFDAGIGVLSDVLMMFTGGQIGDSLAWLWCLFAGTGLAIVATAGRPADPDAPQQGLGALIERGRALEERRERGREKKSRRRREGRADRDRRRRSRAPRSEAPQPDEAPPGEPPPEDPGPPPQSEPDPRMWSKPVGSIRPALPSITTPPPAVT